MREHLINSPRVVEKVSMHQLHANSANYLLITKPTNVYLIADLRLMKHFDICHNYILNCEEL